MSLPDLFHKLTTSLRRHWADVLARDLAAGHDFEPELPVAAFVHLPVNPPRRAVQVSGAAVRQRSAKISINNG